MTDWTLEYSMTELEEFRKISNTHYIQRKDIKLVPGTEFEEEHYEAMSRFISNDEYSMIRLDREVDTNRIRTLISEYIKEQSQSI